MIQTQTRVERDTETAVNWIHDSNQSSLGNIRQKEVNIVIYDRDISYLSQEIYGLLNQEIELRLSGDVKSILGDLSKVIDPKNYPQIIEDINKLLMQFQEITNASSFRLMLATVNTNMCRKFHTDINDLRMLCTYSGPGTLWLSEDNVNRQALNSCGDNDCIVLDENKIQQASSGAVVILKGAIYPQEGAKAVVHRSPTIEETGERRLLLRIDTNEFLNSD